jgi:hypothetical protein
MSSALRLLEHLPFRLLPSRGLASGSLRSFAQLALRRVLHRTRSTKLFARDARFPRFAL